MSAPNRRWLRKTKSLIASPVAAAVFFAAAGASAEVTVELDTLRQRIDGFGASTAFFSEDISQADADFLFDPVNGIGLTLVRVRVNHEAANTTDIETAKKAHAWGVKVWAAPWTPPPKWKTNNDKSGKDKARLKPGNYADFASYLADFVEWMEAQGVPLYAITPQNEPDWEAEWDGCLYSAEEMATFIGDYLGPEFEKRGLDTLIVAPDTAHLSNLPPRAETLVKNANVMKYLDGISTHPYMQEGVMGLPDGWSLPRDNNLFFWQTEISWESFFENSNNDTPDPGMKTGLWMGKMIHEHLTKYWMNAWSYWNLTAAASDYADDPARKNPALIQEGVKYKRAYVLGNYAKFVRPGYTRIEATASPASGLYFSAYKSPTGDRVAVVAINDNNAAASETVKLTGALAGPVLSVTPYVTSDSLALAAQTPVTFSAADNSFPAQLPARSVTTFVLDVEVVEPVGAGGAGGTGGVGGADGTTGGTTAVGGTTATGGVGGTTSAVGGTTAAGGPPTAGSAGSGDLGVGGMPAFGAGGAGNGTAAPAAQTTDSGCGCRVGTQSSQAGQALGALSLLGVAAAFVRRRRSRLG